MEDDERTTADGHHDIRQHCIIKSVLSQRVVVVVFVVDNNFVTSLRKYEYHGYSMQNKFQINANLC